MKNELFCSTSRPKEKSTKSSHLGSCNLLDQSLKQLIDYQNRNVTSYLQVLKCIFCTFIFGTRNIVRIIITFSFFFCSDIWKVHPSLIKMHCWDLVSELQAWHLSGSDNTFKLQIKEKVWIIDETMSLRQFSGEMDEWMKWYYISILIRNSTLSTLSTEMPKEM